jgi:hypothetical protein
VDQGASNLGATQSAKWLGPYLSFGDLSVNHFTTEMRAEDMCPSEKTDICYLPPARTRPGQRTAFVSLNRVLASAFDNPL